MTSNWHDGVRSIFASLFMFRVSLWYCQNISSPAQQKWYFFWGQKMTGWPSEYVFVGLSQSFYSLSRVMLGYSRMVKIQGPIYFHFTANQITFSPQNFSSKPFTIEKVFTLGIILPPNAFQKLSLAPAEGYWKARGWCDWQLAIPNQYLGIEKKSRYLIRY